jgi:hypothetical protein
LGFGFVSWGSLGFTQSGSRLGCALVVDGIERRVFLTEELSESVVLVAFFGLCILFKYFSGKEVPA